MDEIWKPIIGYEGLYEVSNLGRVRSIPRKYCRGRILKQFYTGNGYNAVALSKDGQATTKSVHTLVAIAYVPNPYNNDTVNHKDENKENNRADNLEWLSLKDNLSYGTRVERAKETLTKSIGVPVLQVDENGKVVTEYNSITEAAEAVGISPQNISDCMHQRCISAGGYFWWKKGNANTK